jgi:hypothetical protein
MAQQFDVALGDRSHLAWSQIITGGGGAIAVAGTTDAPTAERIVLGKDLREHTDAKTLSANRVEALDVLQQAYGDNFIERNARADAAVNYFIAAEYMGAPVSMNEAVASVTSGLIEFNGVTIESPDESIDSDMFEFWTRSLTPEDMPFIRQSSGQEIIDQLNSGGINLIPSGGGRYYLQRVDNGTYLTTGGDSGERATIEWPGAGVVQADFMASPEQVHIQMTGPGKTIPVDYTAQDPTGSGL